MPSEMEASANRCKNAAAKIEALLCHFVPEACKGKLLRRVLLDDAALALVGDLFAQVVEGSLLVVHEDRLGLYTLKVILASVPR